MKPKPIATLHWMDRGIERSRKIYTQMTLDEDVQDYKQRGCVFWVCMGRGGVPPLLATRVRGHVVGD